MILPPKYDDESLERDRLKATELFRKERLEEPVEAYHELFDNYLGVVEELLESTVDLTALDEHALAVMSNAALAEAFRYLAGPFISKDDLLIVADAATLNPERLKKDPAALGRIIQVVKDGLDRRRFVWIAEGREPSETEKNAAIVASAALMATQRVQTERRTQAKTAQEQLVEDALLAAGLTKVSTRKVQMLSDAPAPGHFCRESTLGDRKADFVIRLWDTRVLAIECKVSNSSTNSIKRLSNDAVVKGGAWRVGFGEIQIVPAALLSGVFKLRTLISAQKNGMTIFWAHDLDALLKWIENTRAPA